MVNMLFSLMTLVILVFVTTLTTILVFSENTRVAVVYDCRMLIGNWHPDFPLAAVEECKKRIKQ